MTLNPSEVSSQALTSAALQAEGSRTTGPLVMLSARILLRQPPLSCRGRWGVGERGRDVSWHRRATMMKVVAQGHRWLTYRERSAPSVGAGHQAALRRGQRDVELRVVQQEGACHAHRNGHVADDVLATGSCHLQGEQRRVDLCLTCVLKR